VKRWLMIAALSTISIRAKLCPIQIRRPPPNGRYAGPGTVFIRAGKNRVGSKVSGSGHQARIVVDVVDRG